MRADVSIVYSGNKERYILVTAHAGTIMRRFSISFFFFQAEDGIRDVERSRGLGDVYKRQDFSGI